MRGKRRKAFHLADLVKCLDFRVGRRGGVGVGVGGGSEGEGVARSWARVRAAWVKERLRFEGAAKI